MNNLDNLESNSILIIPSNIKEKVIAKLSESDTLYNVKIISFMELKKGLLFDFTNEAIYAVMKEYKVNYGVSKNYINDLYYLEKDNYEDKKLQKLGEIKNFLNAKNLLIKDSLFKSLLKSKRKLYVFGFDYINKFNNYLLKLASSYVDVEILEKEDKNYRQSVRSFHTMNDEIKYVAESIASLIDKGISIDKIFVANYSDEYYFSFKRIFDAYNIPFYVKGENTLYTTSMGRYFIKNLSNNLDLLLYKIRKHFKVDEIKENEMVYNKLSSLVNNYYWCDDILDIKDLIIEEMRVTKVPKAHQRWEVKTTNILDNIFFDDEYVFLMGFNLGSIPKIKKDEDYLNDDIKPEIVDKSYEYNKNIKDSYIRAITNIKNLTITYKEMSAFNSYFPSFLCDYPQFEKIKGENNVSFYSDEINKLEYATSLDNLIKFNERNDLLPLYCSTYDIPYDTYDNSFEGINEDTLFKQLDNKIKFSYSNIIHYYKCPFMFYISDILKVREYESTLDQFIGSLFHHCLEICLESDKDVGLVYDEYVKINKSTLSPKEEFFIRVLKDEIHFVINAIKEQYSHSSHKEVWQEKEIEIPIIRKIRTTIKGFVDKVLVNDNKVLIIDYKTSNTQKINKDFFEFGIDIQLPIYLYLLKQLDNNIEVAGFYLQHILNLDMKYDPDRDAIEEKKKKLKLDGITFNNEGVISIFDDSYENSEVIQSLKVTKSYGGIKNSNRILDIKERDNIELLVENLIINCIDKVVEGDFKIQPIDINYGKQTGCQFCDYRDICYRKQTNFKRVVVDAGGDDNE